MKNTILNKKRRLNYLYKIVNKDWELVTFKPNRAQQFVRDKEIEHIKKYGRPRIIILKGRQLGITTYKEIDWLDACMFKENQTIIITAHNQEKQQEMFQKVKIAFENIPDQIEDPEVPWWVRRKPKPKYDSKTEYYFEENNSRIKVSLDSRSGTPTALHITELAFRDNAKEMMTGTLPSLPKTAPMTIETTANGAWGYFYTFWNKYKNNPKGDFECIFIPRYTDQDYVLEEYRETPDELLYLHDLKRFDTWEKLTQEQINWACNEYEKLGREFFQEFPSTPDEAFLTSGDPVFNISIIRALPVLEYRQDRLFDWLRIYKNNFTYAYFWVDTAEWWENWDYSSISVRDIDMSLLASFYDKYPPDALCEVIHHLRGMFPKGIIGIERNNTGLTTIKTAENGITNDNERYKVWNKYLYQEKTIDKNTKKITWKTWRHTNTRTRPLLIWEYEQAIRLWELTEFDERWRSESYSFVYNENKKPEAMQDCHDDAIMADAICYQMRKEPVRRDKTEKREKRRRKIIDPVTGDLVTI